MMSSKALSTVPRPASSQRTPRVGALDRGDRPLDRRDMVGRVVGVAAQRHRDQSRSCRRPSRARIVGRAGDRGDRAAAGQAARSDRPRRSAWSAAASERTRMVSDAGGRQPGRGDALVGRAGLARRRHRRRRPSACRPCAPATAHPITNAIQSAIIVLGRFADAAATRRTPRASAPSEEVGGASESMSATLPAAGRPVIGAPWRLVRRAPRRHLRPA